MNDTGLLQPNQKKPSLSSDSRDVDVRESSFDHNFVPPKYLGCSGHKLSLLIGVSAGAGFLLFVSCISIFCTSWLDDLD